MNTYKKRMQTKTPKKILKIIHQTTKTIKNSSMLEKTIKIKNKTPTFNLKNTSDNIISLTNLLSKKPLILTFYRDK